MPNHEHTYQSWPASIPPQPEETTQARRCVGCGQIEVRESDGEPWRVESKGVALLNEEKR